MFKIELHGREKKAEGLNQIGKNAMEDIWFATNSKNYVFNVEDVKVRKKLLHLIELMENQKIGMKPKMVIFVIHIPQTFGMIYLYLTGQCPKIQLIQLKSLKKLLAKLILASSNENDIIFDPFLGSGSTSVTARKLNRHYVGIELNPQYCAWAEYRLERAKTEKNIQGYSGGVFWERNTLAEQQKQSSVNLKTLNDDEKFIQSRGRMMDYNKRVIDELIDTIQSHYGIGDKSRLEPIIKEKFNLTIDRSVYYNEHFSIRFSQSKTESFSNTVLSLSALQKYDSKPFIVCLVMPDKNRLMLANTSCLSKISHSSHELRMDNIKGSFNGSDIMKYIGVIKKFSRKF